MLTSLNSESEYYSEVLWSAEGDVALDYLHQRAFTDAILKDFHIGYCPAGPGYFSNRIVFPIYDCLGDVRGFSGRAIPGTSSVKYLNSKESEGFSKSRLLFGLSRNREDIFLKDKVIFVEGFTDVLALAQSGNNLCVAGMGVALTEPQLALIARYTRNLSLCFDSDMQGNAAFHKSVKKAKNLGFNIRRIILPEGKDPADLLMG